MASSLSLLLCLFVVFIPHCLAQYNASNCAVPYEDCGFYSTCVENKDPCGSNGYAIGYGQHYCQLFGTNANLFSAAGQKWIHAVRICLLQQLVPEMNSSPLPTCSALQTYAFSSHVHCYTAPTSDATVSVCNLGVTDLLALLYTIRAAVFDQTKLTLTQGIEVLQVCGSNLLSSAKVGISLPSNFLNSLSYNTTFSSLAKLETAICNGFASYANHNQESMLCAIFVNKTSHSLILSLAVIPSLSFSSPSSVISTIVTGITTGKLTSLQVTGDLSSSPITIPLDSSSNTQACNNGPCFTTAQLLADMNSAPAPSSSPSGSPSGSPSPSSNPSVPNSSISVNPATTFLYVLIMACLSLLIAQ